MPSKPSYKSWTLWFNLGLGIWHVLSGQGIVPPVPPGIEAGGLILGNGALRLKSDQPITLF